MKTKTDLINNWILKANKDLASVGHELTFGDDAVTEATCFHSQQAAETYLKAYLVHLEISSPIASQEEKNQFLYRLVSTWLKLSTGLADLKFLISSVLKIRIFSTYQAHPKKYQAYKKNVPTSWEKGL